MSREMSSEANHLQILKWCHIGNGVLNSSSELVICKIPETLKDLINSKTWILNYQKFKKNKGSTELTIVADFEEADMVNHLQDYYCLDHCKFPSKIITKKKKTYYQQHIAFDRFNLTAL